MSSLCESFRRLRWPNSDGETVWPPAVYFLGIDLRCRHRHLIYTDCLLTQPACLPLLTVPNSYVANHCFCTASGASVLICPCMHCHGFIQLLAISLYVLGCRPLIDGDSVIENDILSNWNQSVSTLILINSFLSFSLIMIMHLVSFPTMPCVYLA